MAVSKLKVAASSVNPRAVVGSGLLWAWVDALFMSTFFRMGGSHGFMPEVAAMGVSLVGVPICLVFYWRADAVRRMMTGTSMLVGAGVLGSVGSALVALAGFIGSWVVLGTGIVLCALFMVVAIFSWGAVYCKEGAKSAMLYVSGGFASALVLNLFLLVMIPSASTAAAALLPVCTCLLLLSLRKEERVYASYGAGGNPSARDRLDAGVGSQEKRGLLPYLGVTPMTLCGLVLIMVGLGYMQHLMSFSNVGAMGLAGGVTLQIARGVVAAALFAIVLLAPSRASTVYRVGLLAIVAGFSLMPFLAGTDRFWVAGAIVISGYVIFDVFIWVIVAQASCIKKCDPLRTVLVMRQIVNGGCMAFGAAIGVLFSKFAPASAFQHPEAIFIGYLMTVAIVLLMGSKDTWELFEAKPPANATVESDVGLHARLQKLGEGWGLTQRERDIFELLAVGRTQPRIAESLCIAESTVNSHVRHIYRKAGVNGKQELLDYVVLAPVDTSVDTSSTFDLSSRETGETSV